jgi:hypothetical protein
MFDKQPSLISRTATKFHFNHFTSTGDGYRDMLRNVARSAVNLCSVLAENIWKEFGYGIQKCPAGLTLASVM